MLWRHEEADAPDPRAGGALLAAKWPGGGSPEGAIPGGAPPTRGLDRCRVSSRLVPLRSEPDVVDGLLLGRLDIGDEVDVLRQEGTHCLVRTPSGAEGWVPGLALTGGLGTTHLGDVDDGS